MDFSDMRAYFEAGRTLDPAARIESLRALEAAIRAAEGETCQALQADLQEVGLGCELIQTENMADIRAAGEYDFCSANDSTAPTADPEVFLFQHYYTGGSSNYQNYSNPAVDSLIDTLAATFDPDERQSVAREASEQILQDAGSLYVGYIYGNTVVSSRVQGAKQFPIDYYIVTKDITLS